MSINLYREVQNFLYISGIQSCEAQNAHRTEKACQRNFAILFCCYAGIQRVPDIPLFSFCCCQFINETPGKKDKFFCRKDVFLSIPLQKNLTKITSLLQLR